MRVDPFAILFGVVLFMGVGAPVLIGTMHEWVPIKLENPAQLQPTAAYSVSPGRPVSTAVEKLTWSEHRKRLLRYRPKRAAPAVADEPVETSDRQVGTFAVNEPAKRRTIRGERAIAGPVVLPTRKGRTSKRRVPLCECHC